jgi:hypothetical protein
MPSSRRKRQAKLGFRVLAAEGELKVSTKEDFEKKRQDKEYDSYVLSKKRKLRWWRRNAERYNAKRRAVARSITGRYKEAERRARSKGESWEFTPDSWEQMWIDAGRVLIPGTATTQNPAGVIVPAFALRGNHRYKHTFMHRIDFNKGWSVDNCRIYFRGEELNADNEWYRSVN